MANPQNVELEAAKFLHKLIQESKDEPSKLATKLYVILQHMRSSGKENSMPYQVISRAMETVIKEHNLDIETLMSSRLPLAAGTQIGDSASQQLTGSSQRVEAAKESKSGNEIGTPETYASTRTHSGPITVSGGQDMYQGSTAHIGGVAVKVHGVPSGAPVSFLPADSTNRMQFSNPSFDGHGLAAKMSKDRSVEGFPFGDHSAGKSLSGNTLDHGGSSLVANANTGSLAEPNLTRTAGSRDTGKSPVPQASNAGLPFKEHQLKQLRAQCLVFLAFRNGLMPKKLHLEIALGNIYSKEDGTRRDLVDQKGKDQLVHVPSSVLDVPRSMETADSSKGLPPLLNSNSPKEADFVKFPDERISQPGVPVENEQDRKCSVRRGKTDTEVTREEAIESRLSAQRETHDSSIRETFSGDHEDDLGNHHQRNCISSAVMTPFEQSVLVDSGPFVDGFANEIANTSVPTTFVTDEGVRQRPEDTTGHAQNPMDCNNLGKSYTKKTFSNLPLKDKWKPVSGMSGQIYPAMPIKDSSVTVRNFYQDADQEEGYASMSTNRQPSPRHTTVEKWILDRQKRKVIAEHNWARKQQKTSQKITACSDRLKEIVSSSEDISAKTKSVIELKKLQLLELQRHLRIDILNDFFKPITSEMDRLKSIKKHRIGRRSKQIERYELKMKEERQKRIRERQKEFFSEIELHRERLEDGFKVKRERWKGLNRYIREFHKRKERFHREKIDRIQREKINLLKINDVEGYLRMVQDTKSDRVNKLLKETEKYLQKLGSKLKDAKAMAGQFETDIEAIKGGTVEESEDVENEDEKDQAKHYLESNEKYYMMAHSVKENITDQPTCLVGGKLREYQMNGLRWLVSLYNNHLNGILADEMGLGKTVQVISLICYLMENKNDRGPFLVVVPSSVLPGWESEINFWAPSIHKIVYCGPPEERRRLFKEQIVHQKFNVLLTTYEYLMNKHDRPKLSKVHWHYIIIDEGHRIKNASCKLNAELKHYRSNHRLLLTGTPLQNSLEELWALLNFLLPNIFNSSEDFSQWFNKPFEGNGDNSPDEALLSEEENLLIINRLHQVLRPFVLRRLKHKVENQLPEKIERLIRCEASAYQKLLMKRVEDNLGAIGTAKARTVHNSVMELRNICNHPYLSQLHVEEVHDLIPKHYLPNLVRLCGKLEMLDRLLPKLKATDHRVLLFSTMTRLLDVMEDYLCWKQYRYLRLDGHTSGGDRGALIENFNNPDSPYFIFLLSIRAGGVGVNLQAADTVILFDTDWNPQVDLQAQARAHRIGQKKDVLVLRLETVQTVEEQVRASAEHKLGVANQSITAGFFDNNTSAEDRREYLESLLRECKKEEAAPVLDDDSLNDIIARSESEIDVFESVDKQRCTDEMASWQNLCGAKGTDKSKHIPPLPSRLLTDDDLKSFYEVMKISEAPASSVLPDPGMKRQGGCIRGLDTQQYGRGKRAREVRSYEEQWTEEEFERLCQADSPESPTMKEEGTRKSLAVTTNSTVVVMAEMQAPAVPQLPQHPTVEPVVLQNKEATPPSKRGRGRPKRAVEVSSSVPSPGLLGPEKAEVTKVGATHVEPGADSLACTTHVGSSTKIAKELKLPATPNSGPPIPPSLIPAPQVAGSPSSSGRGRGRGRKSQTGGEAPALRRRGKRQTTSLQTVNITSSLPVTDNLPVGIQGELVPSSAMTTSSSSVSVTRNTKEVGSQPNSVSPAPVLPSASVPSNADVGPQQGVTHGSLVASSNAFIGSVAVASVNQADSGIVPTSNPQATPPSLSDAAVTQSITPSLSITTQGRGRGRGRGRGQGQGQNPQSREEAPQRRRRRQDPVVSIVSGALTSQDSMSTEPQLKRTRASVGRKDTVRGERGQELPNASKYAGQGIEDSSAERVSNGYVKDAGIDVEKIEGSLQEKEGSNDTGEVLASKYAISDNLPSISTLDAAVTNLNSVVYKYGNLSAEECEETDSKKQPDDKDHCGGSSLISIVHSQSDDKNQGATEECLLETRSNSVEMEKDQSLNSCTVGAAGKITSAPLLAVSGKLDSPSQKEVDKIILSVKSPNMDESLASENLSEKATDDASFGSVPQFSNSQRIGVACEVPQLIAVLDSNPVEMAKEDLASVSVQAASALESMSLPAGESDSSGSPCGKGADKLIESSEYLHVATYSISEIMKDAENESDKALVEEKVNNSVPAGIPGPTTNDAVPAFKPAQEMSNQSHKIENPGEQESKETLGNKDFDPNSVSTFNIRMSDEAVPSPMEEKAELGSGSGLREAEKTETGDLAMLHLEQNVEREECSVSTSLGFAAIAEKAADKSEDTFEDDTVGVEIENDHVEVLASKPQSCDNSLEPNAAFSCPVPLSGSQSASDEQLETKEFDNNVTHVASSDDSVPDISGSLSRSLSGHCCNEPEMPADENANTSLELEDKSGGKAEAHAEVSILTTEVSGHIQEESCELDGGEDTISEVVEDKIGNDSSQLDEHAKENPACNVPILTIQVCHSAVENSVVLAQGPASGGGSGVESGEPDTDKHAKEDDLQVEVSLSNTNVELNHGDYDTVKDKDLDPKSESTESSGLLEKSLEPENVTRSEN